MKFELTIPRRLGWWAQAAVAGFGALVAAAGDVRGGVLAAHLPVVLTSLNKDALAAPKLPDGKVSFAFYGVIDEPGEKRAVQADLEKDDVLYVEMLIPKLPPETDIPPERLPTLTLVAPSGETQVFTANRSEVFDEPYTDTSYISYSVGRMSAEQGTYTMEITGPVPARFVLAVGEEERPGEVVKGHIAEISDVHDWYKTPPGTVTVADADE
ncbi:hypothetical protein D0T12_22795 [Actinomadura spongiicola]|uniref:Uncharacterized protein n=1 Tax=Actinomadura spongiicola TaxID=2303421 RepID=A0A372GCB0_9ACTN|nr:hypothetical protein [Actinomadura spongiicola]RFS83026.1 hypothetical protein D0T12_22795 [Actinomadura spongiicola]